MANPTPTTSKGRRSTNKSRSEKAKDMAAKTSRKISSAAQDTVSAVSDQAENLAEGAVQSLKSKAVHAADQGKSTTDDLIRSVGRAIEAGSQSLEDDGMMATAGYVRAAANGLHQAADEVDGVNTGQLVSRMENFVRGRPLLTVGALALAGFAIASTLKNNNRKS